ncbi:MAG: COX15/CtaA family protein [Catalinimonas sp.]
MRRETTRTKKPDRFGRLGIATVAAVYLLILVGGVVRSTGAGMGCPDWPKCFGSWVPPTDVAQLPTDYREQYAEQRRLKNVRMAGYLERFGYPQLAYEIAHDPAIYDEATFNPTKTWIEYVNRLVGAVIGLLILATFVTSLRYRQTVPRVPILAGAAFLITLFQGWLGSVVVSTNLLPWLITLHMALAIAIVGILIYLVTYATRDRWQAPTASEAVGGRRMLSGLAIVVMALTFLQIMLGTQVREQIDVIAQQVADRADWIAALDVTFVVHRSFSWLLVFAQVSLWWGVRRRFGTGNSLYRTAVVLIAFVALEVVIGVTLAYFAMPAFAQPLHLLLGTLLIGGQLFLWSQLKLQTRVETENRYVTASA